MNSTLRDLIARNKNKSEIFLFVCFLYCFCFSNKNNCDRMKGKYKRVNIISMSYVLLLFLFIALEFLYCILLNCILYNENKVLWLGTMVTSCGYLYHSKLGKKSSKLIQVEKINSAVPWICECVTHTYILYVVYNIGVLILYSKTFLSFL